MEAIEITETFSSFFKKGNTENFITYNFWSFPIGTQPVRGYVRGY
jgi:hypothetical protein